MRARSKHVRSATCLARQARPTLFDRVVIEALEGRRLLTTTPLLSDAFSSATSLNINAGITAAGRQSGLFSTSGWAEASATASGTHDNLTQVNSGVANTLLLATNVPGGRASAYAAAPAALLDPRYGLSRVQVEITPLGTGSTGISTDHWAGLSIGGSAGTSVNAAGVSGVLVRNTGAYQVWENGTKVASGTLSGATTFAVDYVIQPTGSYSLSLNGTSVYSGAHAAPYGDGTITLCNYSINTSTGVQNDYFKNFAVTGETDPTSLVLDNFNTASSSNVNGTVTSTGRQTGLFSPMFWSESEQTLPNQTYDYLTQVGNGSSPNTLLLGANASAGRTSSYVSTPAAMLDPRFGLSNVSVTITPMGPGSTAATDHWAGLAIGGAAGSAITAAGVSGIFVRPNGNYGIYENGTSVATGNVSGTTFTVSYAIRPTGGYTVWLNGAAVYYGTHAGGFANAGAITLQNFSASGSSGLQLDYFDNFSVSGYVNRAAANAAYYVSPTGSDANTGLSASSPWKTLAKANQYVYGPGNSILLQGGQTFTGSLTLYAPDSGTSTNPMTVGRYGSGVATINSGGASAVALRDTQYVNVSNLKLVGSGYNTNTGAGIDLRTERRKPILNGYTLTGIEASGFGLCGIQFSVSANDVSVTYSNLHDNGDGGLLLANTDSYPGQRVYIGNVVARDNAGSSKHQSAFGILVAWANNVVIERSVALNNGWLAGQQGMVGGIQVINCDRALLQYNESAFNKLGSADGDGIVIDSSTNSIMQYNYTHDNDGGGLWMGAESLVTASNNVMRYNVSQNDGRKNDGYGGIFFWTSTNGGRLDNTDVYGNTVYMSPNANGFRSQAVGFGTFTGNNLRVRNNIFVVSGNATMTSRFIRYLSGGTNVLFQGNDYYTTTGTFSLIWKGTTFNSMTAWRAANAAPEQETLNGTAVFKTANPQLASPGTAGTINNPAQLTTLLSQYVLGSTSPLKNVALDLSQFGTAWDPANFAADSFFTGKFSATPKDFYGNTITLTGTGSWSIGASK